MKKKILICLILSVVLLASCNLPEKVTEEMQRTFVASTMQARINEIGSLTPQNARGLEGLIFLRQIDFSLLRTTVLCCIISLSLPQHTGGTVHEA